MKQTLFLLSILTCVLGLLSAQAYGADRRPQPPEIRLDCRKMTDAKRRTQCEEDNRT